MNCSILLRKINKIYFLFVYKLEQAACRRGCVQAILRAGDSAPSHTTYNIGCMQAVLYLATSIKMPYLFCFVLGAMFVYHLHGDFKQLLLDSQAQV